MSRLAPAALCLCVAATLSAQTVTDPNVRPSSATEQPAAEHPLAPAVRMAEEAVEAAEKVPTYTATLYRKVLLNGQFAESTVRMKYRTSPKSVYLYFVEPHAGREALWIEGWNGGNMLAHEGSGVASLIGSVSLAPDSPQAMEGSKNPITRSGLAEMGRTVLQQWREEMKYGEVEAKLFPDATLDGVPCKVIETTHPQPRREFKFHKTRLFLTKDTGVPFAVQQLGWPRQAGQRPPILEDYRYRDLKLNAGLTNQDFDPRNPAYAF